MLVSPSQLKPSQDFLKPQTVRYIFDCINRQAFHELPPSPIVRNDEHGQMIAIDGHNLIAVKLYLAEDIDVHVAQSADDGLSDESWANKIRNHELKEKFDRVLIERARLQQEGIDSFEELISRYIELFPK